MLKDYSRLKGQIRAKKVVLAREDPSYFPQTVMRDPATGLLFKEQSLHRLIHNRISTFKWNLIGVPREHGKTEQAIARILWEIGKNPNIRIKIVSNTDKEAAKRVIAVRDHIENNPEYRRIFPKVRKGKIWTDHKITVQRSVFGGKEPTLEAYGILSGGTGGRADLVVFDDVVDFENSLKNPGMIDKVKEAYLNKWVNLLTKDSRVLYIFTPWHERDLSHDLIRQARKDNIKKSTNEKYKYTECFINNNLDPICPDLWDKQRLKDRLESIRNRAFARGFQGRAMSDDEQLFINVEGCLDHQLTVAEILKKNWPLYAGVDPGHRQKTTSPRSAIVTFAVEPNTRRKFLIDVTSGRWTSPETARRIAKVYERFGYRHRRFNVENNAYQTALIEWMKEIPDTEKVRQKVKAFTTGKNKADEELGLPHVALEMENGSMMFPHGHKERKESCSCFVCDLINEFLSYPVGEYSDKIMAVWMASEAARPSGVAFSGG